MHPFSQQLYKILIYLLFKGFCEYEKFQKTWLKMDAIFIIKVIVYNFYYILEAMNYSFLYNKKVI